MSQGDQRKIGGASEQLVRKARRRNFDDFDCHRSMHSTESVQQSWQDQARDTRHASQSHDPVRCAIQSGHFGPGDVEACENVSRMPQERLSGGRERDRAGLTVQQVGSELALQARYVGAHAGLSSMKNQAGLHEPPAVDNGNEGFEPDELHISHYTSAFRMLTSRNA